MQKLFIVTGVNGIGKSSIIPALKLNLNPLSFKVHDFDERGVPSNADRHWREAEMIHWVNVAKLNSQKNISTIVCGFVKTNDIKSSLIADSVIPVCVCVLDASPATIEKRISNRYTTPLSLTELERNTGKTLEKFISDNVWVAAKFREEAIENGYYVLNTDELSPELVAANIVTWINTQNHKRD